MLAPLPPSDEGGEPLAVEGEKPIQSVGDTSTHRRWISLNEVEFHFSWRDAEGVVPYELCESRERSFTYVQDDSIFMPPLPPSEEGEKT